jgi:N-acetylglucosaminyl-diphospho-decaprenol L-rhamnosyltransferase
MISILIVTYNSGKFIERCIESIVNYVKVENEIIVADNNSSDNTKLLVKKFANVKLIENADNKGFARANNIAFEKSKGEHILVLNPDIIVNERGIQLLLEKLSSDSTIGVIAPRLLNEDGSLQESARKFPNPIIQAIRGFGLSAIFRNRKFYRSNLNLDINLESDSQVDWVIGACMLIKREVFLKVGGFSEDFFMYYEDADLCLKLKKAGFKIIYCPGVGFVHSYQRQSAKSVVSKLKLYHIQSIFRFYYHKYLLYR